MTEYKEKDNRAPLNCITWFKKPHFTVVQTFQDIYLRHEWPLEKPVLGHKVRKKGRKKEGGNRSGDKMCNWNPMSWLLGFHHKA